jgi:ribosome biogenesis GTPase
MTNSSQEFLRLFGWDSFFESHLGQVSRSLFPARVICEERNLYRVQTGLTTAVWAAVSGKLQFNSNSRADFPAVGDWVLIDLPEQADRGVIQQIIPRKTIIYRKQVGTADMQILSTNVDYAFVTTSVNEDLNFRRLERYLAVAREAGTIPVILLTKADICQEKIVGIVEEVQKAFRDIDVHAVSQGHFDEAYFLPHYLVEGSTSIVIGSSGVGKSTLVNYLIGEEKIEVQEIREYDGRGRHTTTSRNLYRSRFGGLVIDTPGMRELQLSDHAEGVAEQFADIEELLRSCRFSDCQHRTEPGCAVKNAMDEGSISQDRWKSYEKLEAEVRHGLRKQNKAIASEDKKVWKRRSREVRGNGRMKKGGFYE